MRRRPLAAAFAATLAGLVLTAATARADPPADAPKPAEVPKDGKDGEKGGKPAPKLVPPKQVSAPPVPYPEGGSGEATVTLEIAVAADGTVDRVTVVDGEEPFAEAARAAALDWKFEPATRDGVPIKATVRAKVIFHVPEPVVEPPPLPPPPPPPGKGPKPKPKPEDEAIDIVVEGVRTEVGTTTISGAEVRILPGAFGDPFRMIEALPGVTPIVSGIPYFYIRGAPPGNAGYFIDGIRVPMLFHLGAGPSVIAPGLVDRVDFHPGGYPARFGRFSGGVIAGETKEPGRFRGEWNVRLFDASAMVESPIDEGKGTALAAGRFGYPGLVLSLVQPEIGLQYWDYQVRAAHKLNDRDQLSAFFFGAFDKLTQTRNGVKTTLFGVQFHRGDVRFDRQIDGGTLRIAGTLGVDQSSVGDDSCRNQYDYAPGEAPPPTKDCGDLFHVRSLLAGVRVEVERRLDAAVKLRAGADFLTERFSVHAANNDRDTEEAARLFPTRTDYTYGVRSDLVIKAAPTVEVVPGARFDVYHSGGQSAVALEPRLAVRAEVRKKVWWLSTLGVAQQAPSFVVPVPGLKVADLGVGLQKAFQFAEGVEAELPYAMTAKLVGFYHAYLNLNDIIATCIDDGGGTRNNDCQIDDRARGRTYGLEVMLRRALTERIGGWLSYTLSRSERTFMGETFLSQFDRPHVASAVGSVDLGLGWRFGARLSFVSGRPAYQRFGAYYELPPGVPSNVPSIGPAVRLERLPPFHRVDVRLEKRWTMGPRSHISFTVEWFNMLMKKEAVDWTRCRVQTMSCQLDEVGPVTIPSLGLEGGF